LRSHFLGRFEGNWEWEVRRGLDPSNKLSLPYIEGSREGKGREEKRRRSNGWEGGRKAKGNQAAVWQCHSNIRSLP